MNEAAGFHDHFSDVSSGYARFRPSYPRELVELLASLAPARGLAWECGCGSGQLSGLLVDRFERVIATDASAAQLTAARPHPRIEFRRERAEEPSLAAASADLVCAAQAAHWYDLERFYAAVRRVARPGALVALASYDASLLDPGLQPLFERFYRETLRGFWPPERIHVEDGYRTLPFPFPELDAPPLEIRAELTGAEFAGYVGTWSAVRALLHAGREGELTSFRRELCELWGPPERRRLVRWPLALRLGRIESR